MSKSNWSPWLVIPRWLQAADQRVISLTRRYSLVTLRVALGAVFIWFGALKLFGVSPVESLVADTLHWLPPTVAVKGLGAIEVIVGLGLLTGWAIRITLLLFLLQMAGTFLVFIVMPHRAFQAGNPLLLTTEGEFVLKNLVLITAGLVIASTVPKAMRGEPLARMVTRKPKQQARVG